MVYYDMFSSRATFRLLRRGFPSIRLFSFRTISADVAVFFVHFLDVEQKDLFTFIHWRALTIATWGFPAKYNATTLSCLNCIRYDFFAKQLSPKCFCKLVNNLISCYWNKSVSCRTSGLEMTAVWSWLQFFHLIGSRTRGRKRRRLILRTSRQIALNFIV